MKQGQTYDLSDELLCKKQFEICTENRVDSGKNRICNGDSGTTSLSRRYERAKTLDYLGFRIAKSRIEQANLLKLTESNFDSLF